MQNDPGLLHFLWFSVSVTAPAFGWVIAGTLLRRLGVLSDAFINGGSRLMFNFGMPTVLFFGAAQLDFGGIVSSSYLLAGALASVLTVTLAYLYASWRGFPARHRGIFAQGAYRANMAIIGFALCVNAYGQAGIRLAALPIAIWTTLYNVIAVVVLNLTLGRDSSPWAILRDMARNPLILGIAAGVSVAVSDIALPGPALAAGRLLTSVLLPFALFCIGGALSLAALRQSSRETVEACAWKLVVAPLIGVLFGYALGVRGPELGVLFLLQASPVAAASFVMVVAAGGNGALAANIVILTTLVSVMSLTIGLFLLRVLGLV